MAVDYKYLDTPESLSSPEPALPMREPVHYTYLDEGMESENKSLSYSAIKRQTNQALQLSRDMGIDLGQARKQVRWQDMDKETKEQFKKMQDLISEKKLEDWVNNGRTGVELNWQDVKDNTPFLYAKGIIDIAKVPGVAALAIGEQGTTDWKWLQSVNKKLTGWGKSWINYHNEMLEAEYLQPTEKWIQAMQEPFSEHPFSRTYSATLSSSPSYLLSLGAATLTWNPSVGAWVMGVTSGSQAYDQFRAEGIDPDLAGFGAFVYGTVEVLTERIPMDILLKGAGKPLFKRMLMAGTSESVQELFAQMGQNYITEYVRQASSLDPATARQAAIVSWNRIMVGWQDAMAAGGVMGAGAATFVGGRDYRGDLGLKSTPLDDYMGIVEGTLQGVRDIEAASNPPTEASGASVAGQTAVTPPVVVSEQITPQIEPQGGEGIIKTYKSEVGKAKENSDKFLEIEKQSKDERDTKAGFSAWRNWTDSVYNILKSEADKNELGINFEEAVTGSQYINIYKEIYDENGDFVEQIDHKIRLSDHKQVYGGTDSAIEINGEWESGLQEFVDGIKEKFFPSPAAVKENLTTETGTPNFSSPSSTGVATAPAAPNLETGGKQRQLPVTAYDQMIAEEMNVIFPTDTYGAYPLKEKLEAAEAEVFQNGAQFAKDRIADENLDPRQRFVYYSALKRYALKTRNMELAQDILNDRNINALATFYGQTVKSMDALLRYPDPFKDLQKVAEARRAKATKEGKLVSEKELSDLQAKYDALEAQYQAKVAELAANPSKAKKPVQRTLVTDERYKEAVNQIKTNIPNIKDLFTGEAGVAPNSESLKAWRDIALYHLETVGRNLQAWTAAMLDTFGPDVQPYLAGEWEKTLKEAQQKAMEKTKAKISEVIKEEKDIAVLSLVVNKYAAMLVESEGIEDRAKLIQRLVEDLQDVIPGFNERIAKELFTFYGQITPLDPNPVKVKLRDLRGQIRQELKIEDLQQGTPPLKTGKEHQLPSDAERRLMQQVEEAKKKYQVPTTDKKTQLRSIMDEVKTRLKNRIKDLSVQINTRQKIVKEKTEIQYDAEAQALQTEKDRLQEQFSEIFERKGLTDLQRLKAATRAAEKSITELTRRIEQKDISKKVKKKSPFSPELVMLQTERDILKLEYDLMKLAIEPKATAEEIELARQKKLIRQRETWLKNRIESIKQEIASGEKTAKTKTDVQYPQYIKDLRAELDELLLQKKEIFGDPKLSLEQKLKRAEAAVERSLKLYTEQIASLEKGVIPAKPETEKLFSPRLKMLETERDIARLERDLLKDALTPKKTAEEIAVQRQKKRLETETKKFQELFNDRDFATPLSNQIELDEEGQAIKRERDMWAERYRVAKQSGLYMTEEEIKNAMSLSQMIQDTYQPAQDNPRPQGSKKATPQELAYGIALKTYQIWKDNLLNSPERPSGLKGHIQKYLNDPVQIPLEFFGILRELDAALDNSWHLNQGSKLLEEALFNFRYDPTQTGFQKFFDSGPMKIWMQAVIDSHKVMWDSGVGKDQMMLYLSATILSDPDFSLIKTSKAALGVTEEELPTGLMQKIPILGKLYKATEGAYNYSATFTRYHLIKDQISRAREAGQVMDKGTLEGLGILVNSQTARGGKAAQSNSVSSMLVNGLFYSPRKFKADVEFYIYNWFNPNLSRYAKTQHAKRFLRVVGIQAAALILANLIDDDSVEWDARSSDFGKIKIGGTRIPVSPFLATIITLGTRLATNEYKSTSTGKVKKIGSFGGLSADDLFWNLIKNKLSPAASIAMDIANRKTRDGDPITAKWLTYKSLSPMALENFYESLSIEDRANLLFIMSSEWYGLGANTYETRKTSKVGTRRRAGRL